MALLLYFPLLAVLRLISSMLGSPGWIFCLFLFSLCTLIMGVPLLARISCSIKSSSFRPQGLQPAKLLCPWHFPGKNTGVHYHFLLQGNLPDPGIEAGSPTLQADSLPSEQPLGQGKSYHSGDNDAGASSSRAKITLNIFIQLSTNTLISRCSELNSSPSLPLEFCVLINDT